MAHERIVGEHPRQVRGAEMFAVLKNRIIRWEYPPGHRFTEEELCKEFNVSRSPVRETLRMLEENGLVDKVPYRGCTVKQPDFKDINELYDVRVILELGVVETIATQGLALNIAEQLGRHWQMFAQVQDFVQVQDVDLAHEDRLFHETLAQSTCNRTLFDLLQTINERLHFARMTDITSVERLRETCHQHLEILSCIEHKDAAAAKEAMRINIEGARQHVKTAIKEALARAYLSLYE